MKKYFLIHILFLFTVVCYGQQDTIYLNPTEKTLGKVKEISSERVKIEKQNGTIYDLDINDVFRIVYSDGEVEMLIKKREDEYFKNKQYTDHFGRNIVSVNFIYVLLKTIEVHYEYFLMEGGVSLKPYGSYYLDSQSRSTELLKDYAFGLDANYYPAGQGRIKYFLGPGIEYGRYESSRVVRFPGGIVTTSPENVNFYFAYLNNGVLFQPSPKLSIGLVLALGFREDIGRGSADSHTEFRANFGYRF